MNIYPAPDFPPPNFVAFLAERSGLSEEDAAHRLENWLDEYYASASERSASTRAASRAATSYSVDARLSA